MRSERTPSARRYKAALFFLILGALAGVWHNRTMASGKPDVVVVLFRTILAPPANALGSFSRWCSVQTGWLFHGRTLAKDNRDLHTRIAQLEGDNTRLREAEIDLDRMRHDLGFIQSLHSLPLAADVLWRRPDPKFDTITISRGSRDGIHVNSVVVTRNGLVGRVTELTPTTCSVLMLTDQNSGAGARVQRAESRATGVCKGDNSHLLTVLYLPNDADIKIGDQLVTSGLGGVFPAGIALGTVTEVKEDEGSLLKRAKVKPAVDFDKLEEVYILP